MRAKPAGRGHVREQRCRSSERAACRPVLSQQCWAPAAPEHNSCFLLEKARGWVGTARGCTLSSRPHTASVSPAGTLGLSPSCPHPATSAAVVLNTPQTPPHPTNPTTTHPTKPPGGCPCCPLGLPGQGKAGEGLAGLLAGGRAQRRAGVSISLLLAAVF